jgi:hypothetical protein
MALGMINESLFHLLGELSNNAQNMLSNINSDIIISLEQTKTINLVREKDKVINKQKNTINKLIYILDVLQNKLIEKDNKVNELKEIITDKIKLTEILSKQLLENNETANNNDNNSNLCNACMENNKEYLYQPCMHVCYCEKCYEKADKHICPICRTKNSELTKIYFN